MRRSRGGFMLFGLVGLVMVGLGLLAASSFRTRGLRTHRLHLESEMRARYLAESACEYAVDLVLGRDPAGWHQFALEGGLGRILVGDPDPVDGSRDVLAYGESGGVGSLLLVSIRKDAPLIAGGPPRPGNHRLDGLRDLGYTGASIPDHPLTPGERQALFRECRDLRSHMNGQELLEEGAIRLSGRFAPARLSL